MPQSFLVEGTGLSPAWDQGFLDPGAQIYCLVYLCSSMTWEERRIREDLALLLLQADKINYIALTH